MEEKIKKTWAPLSPKAIYLVFKGLLKWREDAEKFYENLNEKDEVNTSLKKLLKKTSAIEACKVMTEISLLFGLSDLSKFCTQQKFSGLLGVNQIVSIALSGVYFHSKIKDDLTNFFGRVVIDHQAICDLSAPMESHDVFQEIINKNDQVVNIKFYSLIQQVKILHDTKMYSLTAFRGLVKQFRELPVSYHEPISYLLYKVNIRPEVQDADYKEFNFFDQAKNKEAGGFFQNLCIMLFSLDFSGLLPVEDLNSVK